MAAYVTRARQGERFVVTDRGVPVAELGPVSDAVRGLWEMVASGRVRWNGGKPIGARIAYDGPSLSDAVIEDRG
ncbi:type II toxin-antitoxin system prevent-host-death family antitoxin [bacterium]|nr:type II toxin-antitoxin system prevent-host-death family antitoxin [Chloroflexi bacterium CFX6]RIL10851.1 MAG: type II toxin-antitoxin system prevent-host-death family antitoxin [bacterium]